ncbi:DUF4432 family protein [Plantibacter sp. YIM 135249]|uniref:DUF4432 family protein n=1 Tax=Plantibacter sp. YIM 135249 TaxID=3423918 RepID=UPI003D329213
MVGIPLSIVDSTVDGDRILEIVDDCVRLRINVDHGAHLFHLEDVRSGTQLLYTDPAGSRDYAVGGWYELFPNAGPACDFGGSSITRHGDVQHRPWTVDVEADDGNEVVIRLRTTSRDLPFSIEKRVAVRASSGRIRLDERIARHQDGAADTADELPYLWGQHVTFGLPFLEGAVFELPGGELHGSVDDSGSGDARTETRGPLGAFPVSDGTSMDLTRFPTGPFDAMLFSDRLASGAATVRNPRLGIAARLTWDIDAYPYLWFWGTRSADVDGLTACAIEPQASDIPSLADAHTDGRAPVLARGGERSSWIELTLSVDSSPGIADE